MSDAKPSIRAEIRQSGGKKLILRQGKLTELSKYSGVELQFETGKTWIIDLFACAAASNAWMRLDDVTLVKDP